MAIGITSCWHLRGDRLEGQMYWVRQALLQMKAEGVKAVLHCGDLFHYARIGTKEGPAPVVIGALRRVVEEVGLPIFLAEGNHDQVEGYPTSAVRAIDGCPYLAHAGDFDSFELPFPGFGSSSGSFIAVDWRPRMSVEDWKTELRGRLQRASGHFSVIFGHADLLEAALVIPGVSPPAWPRPSVDDLWEVLDCCKNALCFFGHNHSGMPIRRTGPSVVMGVGALMRSRWDEAGHQDGWYMVRGLGYGGVTEVEHFPLDGPVFRDFSEIEGCPELGAYSWPRLSHVRMNRSQAAEHGDLDVLTQAGVKVEVVPDQTSVRDRSQEQDTSVRFGMSPADAFEAWAWEQKAIDVELVQEASLMLAKVLDAGGVALQGSQPRIGQVREVALAGHLMSPGVRALKTFEPGWNSLLGPTGCGKSSLLEATYVALYGQWPSRYRRDALWGPFVGDGEAWTSLDLSDGKCLRVLRTRIKGTPSVVATLDGEQVTPYTQPTKVQPALSRLVDDPDLLLRSAFLTQDRDPDLVESAPEARIKAFNDVLGISQVAEVRELVAARLKVAEPGRREFLALEIEIAELSKSSAFLLSEAVKLKCDLEEANTYAKQVEDLFSRCREAHRVSHLVSEVEALRATIASAPSEDDVDAAAAMRSDLERCLTLAQADYDTITRLQSQVSKAQRAETQLALVGCAPCFLPCPLIDEAREHVGAGKEAERQLSYGRETLFDVNERMCELRAALAEASAKEYRVEMDRKLAQQAETRLMELARRHDLTQLGPHLEPAQDLHQLEHAHKSALCKSMSIERDLAGKRALQDEGVRRLRLATTRKAELLGTLTEYPALKLLSEAFARDGVQRILLEQGLPGLQAELDSLVLLGGISDLRVQLDFPSAAIDPKAAPSVLVSVRGGPWVEAKVLSGGQREVVRVLVRLACCLWSSRGTGAGGVLFLDEPTQGLSEDYVEALVIILRDLVGPGKSFSQGIACSHDETFVALLGGNVIEV